MCRIPMVKSFVLKKGDDPNKKECRYIPHNEFRLWKYYMQNHHKFLVMDEQESLWIDEDEYTRYMQIYNKLDLEKVIEIKILLFAYKPQLIIPISRYIEEKNYEKIKRLVLSHYSERNKDSIRDIKEKKGYWIKR
jgi:hypothetical protein